MVKAECLPTEIWLEIFSYLSSNHNIRAFSRLNQYFDGFLLTKYFGVRHHVRPENCLPISSKHFISSPRLETIRSLCHRHRTPKCLILLLNLYSDQLINLQNLTVCLRQKTQFGITGHLAGILENLPSLKSLEIRAFTKHIGVKNMEWLLMFLFSERLALTHCRLLFSLEECNLRLVRWVGTPSIRYLTLGAISYANLLVILSRTRDLIGLDVIIFKSEFEPSTLVLPSLRKVDLCIREMSFALLIDIRRLAPHINVFSVRGSPSISDENFFREDSWRKLFDQLPSYKISLTNWTWWSNEKTRLKRFHDSLTEQKWFKISDNHGNLRVNISFQSN